MHKLNVAILFGGRSAEHEVSLQSAKNVYNAIDKKKYNPILIGIDKSGKWLLQDSAKFLINADNPKLIKLNTSDKNLAIVPQKNSSLINITDNQPTQKIDVVFPVLHGTYGEDGTVQGLFKLLNIPFVGAGVLGSAVGMDKDVAKRLLRDANIPTAKFIVARAPNKVTFDKATKELGLPMFIKPVNAGSSVGVSKVTTDKEFYIAIAEAFKYDRKIMIEEYMKGKEIECSVLGNENPIASVPGEVIVNAEFYSYEAKYIDENGAVLEIPAKLEKSVIEKIQRIAVDAYKVLECEGMARVDFFLKENGEPIINEINTIPGFTKISMYPKLWEASGISYTELIDRLIQLAIARFKKEQKLLTSFPLYRQY